MPSGLINRPADDTVDSYTSRRSPTGQLLASIILFGIFYSSDHVSRKYDIEHTEHFLLSIIRSGRSHPDSLVFPGLCSLAYFFPASFVRPLEQTRCHPS